VKRSLLHLRLLYQFFDPIEHSLIGNSGRHTLVMLDLAVEFDAPVTHPFRLFLGREKRPLILLRLNGSFVSTHRALSDQALCSRFDEPVSGRRHYRQAIGIFIICAATLALRS
jgi:hypothetical protein